MVEEKEKDDERKNTATTKSNSKKSYITKRTNLFCKVRKNDQRKITEKRYNKKSRTAGPRRHRTKKTQQGGSILENIVKLGAKLGASNLLKQG